MLNFIQENIPPEMQQFPQWVCWKAMPGAKGKVDKIPFDPKTGKAASSTNPATWATFEQAVATSSNGGDYDGVGFVVTKNDPFVGVDLDGCCNDSGEIEPWAWEIVQKLNLHFAPSKNNYMIAWLF
jgi:primase-polymerase (primpol)-like protein